MSYVILYPAQQALFSRVFQASEGKWEASKAREKNNASLISCRLVILYQILKLKQ